MSLAAAPAFVGKESTLQRVRITALNGLLPSSFPQLTSLLGYLEYVCIDRDSRLESELTLTNNHARPQAGV